jgi:hypothetical protein
MTKTTFYSVKYCDWPPVLITDYANPDSLYWQEQGDTAVAHFDQAAPEYLPESEWRRFNELVVNHYGDAFTWKQAYEVYQQTLERLSAGATADSLAFAVGVLPEMPEGVQPK